MTDDPTTGVARFMARLQNLAESDGGRAALAPPNVPGYEILGELGRGGMGAVYKARQVNLNRTVALKVVLGGGRVAVARFWAEAEVVAAVRHPNVVGVYEFGEHIGRPHMAMEFCPGGSLAEKAKPLVPRAAAAALVEKIARGVAAAHAEGIVHRDLKPGNVLFDAAGEPKVADFGLAKRSAVDLTNTQAVMGTPAYMAPEQAEGRTKFAGPPADVWALGVIFHELVAGERPFDGDSAQAIMLKIMAVEPPALRTLVRSAPRDLETVVAKCLTKEPELRYPTAADLADDLARFGRGEPIAARRAGAVERAARWARRKPAAAAAWALGLAVLAVGTFAATTAALWRAAVAANGKVMVALTGETEARQQAVEAQVAAEAARDREAVAKREIAFLNYSHAVDLAHREYLAGNVGNARVLLESVDSAFRRWEWGYVHRLCHGNLATLSGHTAYLVSAAWGPSGGWAVTGSYDGTARVWETDTGQTLAVLRGHTDRVVSVAVSPDGRRVATASSDRTAKIWEAMTGRQVATLSGHTDGLIGVSFSPDGRQILTGSLDGTARVWDAETGSAAFSLLGHKGWVGARYSPDGRRVVTASKDGTARIWDADRFRLLFTLSGHNREILAARFSPDGRQVVTGSTDGTTRVWEVETGVHRYLIDRPGGLIRSVAWSPDGRWIATCSADRHARVWDADNGNPVAALDADGQRGTRTVSFSPDGKFVMVAGLDGTARLWRVGVWRAVAADLRGHTGEVSSAAFSPDSRRVLTTSTDGTGRVWELEGGDRGIRLDRSSAGVDAWVTSAAVAPGGQWVCTGSEDGVVRIWGVGTGVLRRSLLGHVGRVAAISVNQHGDRIATGSDDTVGKIWDRRWGRSIDLRGHTGGITAIAFDGAGTRVATGSADRTARLWDARSGKELGALTGHGGDVTAAAFNPNGDMIITGSSDKTARIWDATTLRGRAVLSGHLDAVVTASFSPAGDRVLTGSTDTTVRVWDVSTGSAVATLRGNRNRVQAVAWSPDGQRVVTGSGDESVRVFDSGTGRLLLTLPVPGRVLAAGFSPDGSRLIVAHGHLDDRQREYVRVFDSAPVNSLVRRIAPMPRAKP